MNLEQIVKKAIKQSNIERMKSNQTYKDNEGVWVPVFKKGNEYSLEQIGEKVFEVEAIKNGYTIHNN